MHFQSFLSRRNRITVIAVCSLVLYGYFILWPAWQGADKAQQKLQTYKDKVQEQEKVVNAIPKLRKEKEKAYQEWLKNEEKLLAKEQRTQILLQLEEGAQMSAISLKGISPGVDKENEAYCFWPLDIEIAGSYWAITDFLRFLEEMPWLLNYESLTVTQEETTINATLRIVTYQKKAG